MNRIFEKKRTRYQLQIKKIKLIMKKLIIKYDIYIDYIKEIITQSYKHLVKKQP